ncbi:uncharacterized protein METZ01_LOCUS244920, partial [marine metagenome]
MAGNLASVASGEVAYLYGSSDAAFSTVVDTLSNIEDVTLSGNGANYVVGSSGANVIVGGTGVDTITTGAGNDTIYGSTGADIIDGEAGTDTYVTSSTQVAANIEGAGTGTSTGLVINLGSTAITKASVLSVTSANLAGNLASVASGEVAYLYGSSDAAFSTVVDTLSNIEDVTLSGNGANYVVGSSGANVIVGGTGVDTITAGAGNDTITGAGGADVIDAGAGNDTLVYLLTADLFSGNAEVDTSFAGGIGTDTLQVGTTGTAFVIANNDIWTGVTGVETISYVANTATVTIDLDVTAYTAGIRTVNVSAGTA